MSRRNSSSSERHPSFRSRVISKTRSNSSSTRRRSVTRGHKSSLAIRRKPVARDSPVAQKKNCYQILMEETGVSLSEAKNYVLFFIQYGRDLEDGFQCNDHLEELITIVECERAVRANLRYKVSVNTIFKWLLSQSDNVRKLANQCVNTPNIVNTCVGYILKKKYSYDFAMKTINKMMNGETNATDMLNLCKNMPVFNRNNESTSFASRKESARTSRIWGQINQSYKKGIQPGHRSPTRSFKTLPPVHSSPTRSAKFERPVPKWVREGTGAPAGMRLPPVHTSPTRPVPKWVREGTTVVKRKSISKKSKRYEQTGIALQMRKMHLEQEYKKQDAQCRKLSPKQCKKPCEVETTKARGVFGIKYNKKQCMKPKPFIVN